jgi:SAM-dependent methyltransferase
MLSNPLTFFRLYRRGQIVSRYAAERLAPGMEFDRFGRTIGQRLLWKAKPVGLSYLLNPVSSFRYFEFSFAYSELPARLSHCLDIGSPRLFSLYIAEHFPSSIIRMINPDQSDIVATNNILRALRIGNIHTACLGVDSLLSRRDRYDCIWSISVVEHINGSYDDRFAVKTIFDSLNNGGRLILTLPVDRRFREEYRDVDYYGIQSEKPGGKYFFQRYYDKAAIWKRLLSLLGKEPSVVRWYGEKVAGRFYEYERRWISEGYQCTVDDAKEIVDNYQEYPSWETMPGVGICGLVINK